MGDCPVGTCYLHRCLAKTPLGMLNSSGMHVERLCSYTIMGTRDGLCSALLVKEGARTCCDTVNEQQYTVVRYKGP